MSYVGQSVPRSDGPAKVTGRAVYTADVELPGLLCGRILRSIHAHARIRRIDPSRAERLPGVVAVLTQQDLLAGDLKPYYGPAIKDQPVVAIRKVRYVGDPVVAVAAEDEDTAEEALGLIEVEYEELPAVGDPISAMQPDAPLIHDEELTGAAAFADLKSVHVGGPSNVCGTFRLRHGDVAVGFAEADEIFEDTFTTPIAHHGHLEPHATVAQFDADGSLTIWSATQTPFIVRGDLAAIFGLPASKVRVIVPYLGGAYGAKAYSKVEPIAAALAYKARRPVKVVLSSREALLTVARHGAVVRMRTGVGRDGTLLARQTDVVMDTGAYAEIGPRVAKNAGYTAAGPYRIPHVSTDAYCVYTNKVPAGAARGFGVAQVCWAFEQQMDIIAHRLGLDPLEIRLKNCLQDGDAFATGETMRSLGLKAALLRTAERIGWPGEPNPPTPFPRPEGTREGGVVDNDEAAWEGGVVDDDGSAREGEAIIDDDPPFPRREGGRGVRFPSRGLGIACAIKSTISPSLSSAAVKVSEDGSVEVLASAVEMGQGSDTILAQICAEELGVPLEWVKVSRPDTGASPYDQQTTAARATFSVGNAVALAARDARQQLLQAVADKLEIDLADLTTRDGQVFVRGEATPRLSFEGAIRARFGSRLGSILGRGDFQTTGGLDPETGQGVASTFWYCGVAAAEVAVDPDTGRVRVLRYVMVSDGGKAINPQLCRQQNEGSTLIGFGQTLFEELEYEGCQPTNATFLDYKLPSIADFPTGFETELVEALHPEGPFGAKGIGEAGTPPAYAAIGNAIANAVGVRIRDLPITPARILEALQQP